jgi:hypothetical protein
LPVETSDWSSDVCSSDLTPLNADEIMKLGKSVTLVESTVNQIAVEAEQSQERVVGSAKDFFTNFRLDVVDYSEAMGKDSASDSTQLK